MFKSIRMLALGGAVAFGALMTQPVLAQVSPAQKSEIESIIKEYLVKNPEVIQDALIELERRQRENEQQARTKALAEVQPMLASSTSAVAGNPKGDVMIVEFFDYNCGFCKRGLTDLQKLIKEDSNLKVVLKDLPILSPGSREAALIAGAVKKQVSADKFWDFHVKLMSKTGQIGKQQALEIAKEIGADLAKIDKDVADPAIAANFEEARKMADALGLTGTPSYVIGDEVVVGAVGFDQLKGKVDNVRKCGKTVCN